MSALIDRCAVIPQELLGDTNREPLDEDELVSLLRDQYNPRSMFSLLFPDTEGTCPPLQRLKLWHMWTPLLECTFEQQTGLAFDLACHVLIPVGPPVYLKAMGILPADDEAESSSSSSTASSVENAPGPISSNATAEATQSFTHSHGRRHPEGPEEHARRHRRRRYKPIYHMTKPLRLILKREPDPEYVDQVESEILAYLKV